MLPSIAPYAVAMAVMLVGMVLGYLANTRADVWRRRFEAERAFYADYRHRAEEQLARRPAPEREQEPPSAPAPMVLAPSPPRALPIRPLTPVSPDEATREIMRIVGISSSIADRLELLGVTTIHDLATLSHEDEMALELRLGLNAGTIARDQWRSQAQLLDGAAPRFGDLER